MTKPTNPPQPEPQASCVVRSGCFFPSKCAENGVCISSVGRRKRPAFFRRDEEPVEGSDDV